MEITLFNILWWLDSDLGSNTENSYFFKPVNELNTMIDM